jgi:hypothetical protein
VTCLSTRCSACLARTQEGNWLARARLSRVGQLSSFGPSPSQLTRIASLAKTGSKEEASNNTNLVACKQQASSKQQSERSKAEPRKGPSKQCIRKTASTHACLHYTSYTFLSLRPEYRHSVGGLASWLVHDSFVNGKFRIEGSLFFAWIGFPSNSTATPF